MCLHLPRGDAAERVAGHHPGDDLGDLRAVSPGLGQRDRAARGHRELVVEAQNALGVRAAEPVDRLVRIAYRDDLGTMGGQLPQEAHLRGVGVLVLVDEDGTQSAHTFRWCLSKQAGGPADQFGVVHGGGQGRDVEVLRVDGCGRPRHWIVAASGRRGEPA